MKYLYAVSVRLYLTDAESLSFYFSLTGLVLAIEFLFFLKNELKLKYIC